MNPLSQQKIRIKMIAALVLWLPLATLAQIPFKLNQQGEVLDKTFDALIAKNKYQAVSAFDTVSKKPLLIYAQYIKNDKFGILDNYGREVTQPLYEEILGLNTDYPLVSMRFPLNYVVKVDGKHGIIDNKGRQLLAPTFKFLFYESGDSVYVTNQGNRDVYIDAKGNPVKYVDPDDPANRPKYVPEFNKILNAAKTVYMIKGNRKKYNYEAPNLGDPISVYNGRVIFNDKATRKYGVYDAVAKKTIIPVTYDRVETGINGYFVVQSGNKVGVIDSLGKITCPVEFDGINRVTGCNLMYQNKKYAQYSKNFVPMSGFVYEGYSYLGRKVSTLKKNGKYGLVNNVDGKALTDFSYDYISTPDEHDLKLPLMIVSQNAKMGLIDYNGKILLAPTYDLLLPESATSSDQSTLRDEGGFFSSNQPNLYFFFRQNGKYGLLGNDFKVLVNNDYDMMIKSNPRTNVNVSKGGKWGILDIATKKLLIPMIYNQKINVRSGYYLEVCQNRKFGLLDPSGKIVMPIEHDEPVDYDSIYKGLIKVSSQGNYTYIDYKGHKVTIIVGK